jgi:hypothetical protein
MEEVDMTDQQETDWRRDLAIDGMDEESAPGSPEAVAQAAETPASASDWDSLYQQRDQLQAALTARTRQAGEMLESFKRMLAERDGARAQAFALKQERDELADALEADGVPTEDPDYQAGLAALRTAGRTS